ncbi:helix-turn-helix domain protein [Methanococcus vannielii SB]|uniref:Helix-turn-helix domain protein n=1 Tax=Methanococcus vannielii (strain ATCC 35089 / DSM 1224 / JCM 13029 / OCM 148 / SB) TaxID=406327 RepID=A6UQT2_METVS|nr:multiprotein bridging factor aMBF1 [Methanococcus vannielii]ABR54854.1 helix-turn-helix domain protein [Methanococcus vannielii SB]
MQCELCGKEVKDIFKTRIEGVDMNVCETCAKFGITPKGYSRMPKAVFNVTSDKKEKTSKKPKKDMFDSLKTIVEDYGTLIREAREKRNMTLEGLARTAGIKESLLHKIERNEIEPEEKYVNILERELKISLYEEGTYNYESKDENADFTLGDFVKIKKR